MYVEYIYIDEKNIDIHPPIKLTFTLSFLKYRPSFTNESYSSFATPDITALYALRGEEAASVTECYKYNKVMLRNNESIKVTLHSPKKKGETINLKSIIQKLCTSKSKFCIKTYSY